MQIQPSSPTRQSPPPSPRALSESHSKESSTCSEGVSGQDDAASCDSGALRSQASAASSQGAEASDADLISPLGDMSLAEALSQKDLRDGIFNDANTAPVSPQQSATLAVVNDGFRAELLRGPPELTAQTLNTAEKIRSLKEQIMQNQAVLAVHVDALQLPWPDADADKVSAGDLDAANLRLSQTKMQVAEQLVAWSQASERLALNALMAVVDEIKTQAGRTSDPPPTDAGWALLTLSAQQFKACVGTTKDRLSDLARCLAKLGAADESSEHDAPGASASPPREKTSDRDVRAALSLYRLLPQWQQRLWAIGAMVGDQLNQWTNLSHMLAKDAQAQKMWQDQVQPLRGKLIDVGQIVTEISPQILLLSDHQKYVGWSAQYISTLDEQDAVTALAANVNQLMTVGVALSDQLNQRAHQGEVGAASAPKAHLQQAQSAAEREALVDIAKVVTRLNPQTLLLSEYQKLAGSSARWILPLNEPGVCARVTARLDKMTEAIAAGSTEAAPADNR